MKTRAIVLAAAAVVAFTPRALVAGLDKTPAECDATYGSPLEPASAPNTGMLRHYLWNGFLVGASFYETAAPDRKSGSVSYEKEVLVTGRGAHEMTSAEIERILAVNAGESSWERLAHGWRRTDNEAFAYEFRFQRDGVPANMLAVFHGERHPQLAATVRASGDRE